MAHNVLSPQSFRNAVRITAELCIVAAIVGVAGGVSAQAQFAIRPQQPAAADGPLSATPSPQSAGTAAEIATPTEPLPGHGLVILRNIFAQAPGAAAMDLRENQSVSVGPQPVRVASAARMRVDSPDASIRVVFRYRPADAPNTWELTVVVIAKERPHDYLYFSDGEQVSAGKLRAQETYSVGAGLETELKLDRGDVRRIVVQDEGDVELRVRQAGDSVDLTLVPPQFGGRPSGVSTPWYRDELLRFQDFTLLFGGYSKDVLNNDVTGWMLPSSTTEHEILELWLHDAVVVRGATFILTREAFSVAQVVYTLQAVRGEHWSLWAEGGASAYEHSLSPSTGSSSSRSGVGWTAGLAAHVRFGDWGTTVHWADTDGPSLLQVMAGWQATRRFGLALSWISYRTAEPLGLAVSFTF